MDNAWSITFDEPVAYEAGLLFQYRLLAARQAGKIPDTVVLLQHTPTVTLGNRGRDNYLLKSEQEYADLGIDLFQVERGGDVTFHGPGQWVLYPILHLGGNEADAHGYLFNLEEIAIQTLATFSVDGFRREGKSGTWTEQGKIAAIGFRLKRWVSFHGMSFNVENELAGFETIVPCGLEGEPVTTLSKLLGEDMPSMPAVGSKLLDCFEEVMGRNLIRYQSMDLLPEALMACDPPRF
ncbi:MAG: lipoyl(octanoyl) transferase [Kiritimatiellaceae bacterium]|jgi:lipoate-protein ligase B|nr:lipoyl(octanoyl) transferase [Kiritimatiellaceae bacterium]|tara:strand:+ start:1608 stop:2318 length:711 start_codon:yes stop_codon:yes gene_type:complete